MRPWTLLVIAGALLSSMLIIAPVRAADDERERFTISGTVWIDENRDRIRQPSEPVLSGVWVHTGISPNGLGGRILSSSYATNEQGQYTIRKYPYREMGGRRYRFVYLEVRYKEPGAEPVYDDWPYPYTHSGCRLLYILEEEEDRTVDIGVSQYGPALPKNRPVDLLEARRYRHKHHSLHTLVFLQGSGEKWRPTRTDPPAGGLYSPSNKMT